LQTSEKQRKTLAEYDGDDKVISSFEMADRLAGQKHLFHVKSQIPTLDKLIDGFVPGELIMLSGRTKNGKCLGKGTKVLMFDGSVKTAEDIVIGDLLMGDDSKPRRVLSTSTGYDEMFRITDKYGESFTANADHILCLQRTRRNSKKDKLADSIVEIAIKDYLLLSKTMKHILKAYRVPAEFQEKKVLIPPYIMGLWLGDGHSNSPAFTTADPEIVNELQKYADENEYQITKKIQEGNKSSIYRICDENGRHGNTGGVAKNNFKESLKHYDLLGKKHIPQDYKANNRENRLQLLAGLIDTDGNTRRTGTLGSGLEFVSKSECLSQDVVWLCRSLGFTSSCKPTIKTIKDIGFSGTYYRVNINGPKGEIPCRLSRKLNGAYQHKKNILRSRFTIEPIGENSYYGVVIDGNGRFLLGDFTVTHNTLLAQTLTNNFNNQDVLSLWFTYELPPRQFLDCFPSVPHTYMPALLKAGNWQWIEDRIMESFLKYHTRVVFIDHLHFVVDIARQQNMSLEIGTIIRRLKLLAVRENFILFVMAHTKKPSDSDHFGEIRDSSFAEQESDVTLMVRRFPDIGPSIACVRVNQSRRTGVMQEKV